MDKLFSFYYSTPQVTDMICKVKKEKTIANLNRLYRYDHNPNESDKLQGRDKIVKKAEVSLTESCNMIDHICTLYKKYTNEDLIVPVKTEEGHYKKVEDMTYDEKLNLFKRYCKVNWLDPLAVEEFLGSE